jgi:cytochrome c biogenesis protein CcmG/thiol:disulfide interchange protein DsbE
MNRVYVLICLLFLTNLAISQRPVKLLPNGKVKDTNGKLVDLNTFTKAGKITIVSFWATWCGPCKKELDAYNAYFADWTKKYGTQLLAISIDDIRGQAKIKPLVNERKWPYTILVDANNDLQRQLGFSSIPQLYLLDQKGNVIYQATGYLPGSEKELEAKMAAAAKSSL